MPRWFSSLGVKKMLFKPWGASIYRTQTTKELESFYNETRPFGFELIKGGTFEFNLIQSYERRDEAFSLTDSMIVSTGKYMMYRNELQFGTSQSRKAWLFVKYNWGDFYSGTIYTFKSWLGINVNSHLNFRNDYTLNKINLHNESIYIHELASYINYAFTTKIDLSLFSQWNSLDDFIFFNVRLHWIPKIGSDMYLVYNQGHDEIKRFDFLRPTNTTGGIKVVYRFTF